MQRRTLLTVLSAGTVPLSGCLSNAGAGATDVGPDPPTDTPTHGRAGLPADCPTSQGLAVEWPDALDASTVESFVESYEHEYYREVVVAYEPRSSLDSYELSGGVTDAPQPVGDGWRLAYEGSGGVYRPTLAIDATRTEPPADADLVPASEIGIEAVSDTVEAAADSGEASYHVEPPGATVDRYLEEFASLSDDFEQLSRRGDSDTLYVDVDGTAVELDVEATSFHGDYWWRAVLRRRAGRPAHVRPGHRSTGRRAAGVSRASVKGENGAPRGGPRGGGRGRRPGAPGVGAITRSRRRGTSDPYLVPAAEPSG